LVDELKRALTERALNAEMDVTIRGRPQEACFTRGRGRRMLGSG
jgi:hypothetical protein